MEKPSSYPPTHFKAMYAPNGPHQASKSIVMSSSVRSAQPVLKHGVYLPTPQMARPLAMYASFQPPLPSAPHPDDVEMMRRQLGLQQRSMRPAMDEVVADVMRIFSDTPVTKMLAMNKDFVTGWRLWSFQMTKAGTISSRIRSDERGQIQKMICRGKEQNSLYKAEWNQFREILSNKLWTGPRTTPYDIQMDEILKTTALVIVDCCFAVKIKCDAEAIVGLLNRMFAESGDSDIPSNYILLDNDIMDCEMNHKLVGGDRYAESVEGVNNYRNFAPDLHKDGICKMRLPFAMSHAALSTSESRVRKEAANNPNFVANRNEINDFAQLALMTRLRRTFKNSKVALLSDDGKLIKHASNNRADVSIVTTNLLERKKFVQWKFENAYPNYADDYEETLNQLRYYEAGN